MNVYLYTAIIAIGAYLIGSVNFSILLSRLISGEDIRKSGSGNAGATNMLRTYGKKMGILTLLLDVLKGVVVILIFRILTNSGIAHAESGFGKELLDAGDYIAGVFVALGHNFPIYFGFKGGKGVATSLGVILMIDWKVGLIIGVCAILVMALTRYVSLGSVLGGAAFIVVEIVKAIVSEDVNIVQIVCSVILGGLLIARHHANIKRLINGTENKLGAKKQ